MSNKQILMRLLALLKPYRTRFFMSLLAMAGTASTQPMLNQAAQVLLDKGFVEHNPDFPLWTIPAVLISIFMARGVFTFSTAYLNNWVLSRVLNDMRRAMFDRLLRMPAARFQQESTAAMINAVIGEVRLVVEMISSVFLAFVRDTLTVIALLAMLLWLNWRLTLVALFVVPATAVIVRFTMRRVRRLNRDNQRVTAEMTQVVEEAARGHQVIRIFAGERYERARFERRSEALRGFSQRITVAAAATVPITQIATAFAVSVVVMMAVREAQTGHMSVGQFTNFLMCTLMLLAPLKSLVEVNGPLQRGLASAETVFGMIDLPPEEDPGTREIGRARGALRFDDVSFSYAGRDEPALSHIALDIAAGETVALVGMSGGGKTTLVSLAARFYLPTAGSISLDGIPYAELTLASLRAQLAMVGQNVVLFDDTLRANIAYGVERVDEARLAQAVQAAHLQAVVAGLPQGLDTPIGENGMRLSGGQRQRVAIARAIYKDAPVLILDEATSALDTESERAVQAALDALMRGRTTLVIAHRLSTIERADRIVVMEHGRIVEVGAHAALLARGGVYANLYKLQFAAETQA
jgi:subfamily B ATP-binding cassette protein MsbA